MRRREQKQLATFSNIICTENGIFIFSSFHIHLKTLNHREVTDLSFLRIEGALNTTDEGPRMQG